MAMQIYLVRHGETTSDVENRYGGDYDDHLTAHGREEAAELAENLAQEHIELLFTSPLIRAQETAEIVGRKLGLVPQTLRPFKERNGYGILTGMTKQEAAQRHPSQVAVTKEVHATVHGAEPYKDFQTRIMRALRDVSKHDARKIAIITHGGPIRLIFRDILKLGEIEIQNCAYALIEQTNDSYSIVKTKGIVTTR